MVLRRRQPQQGIPDSRQVALDTYVEELMGMDPAELAKLVPAEPGFWGVPALATRAGEVDIAVQAFRPWDDDGSEDLQFVAQVLSRHRLYRIFAEGFAIRSGMIEPLSDDDWAMWNI